ncbi:MAG: response regulator transcription factor [Bryobacteraceae bacterium]
MNSNGREKTVVICETQPVTSEGIRSTLESCYDLKLVGTASSLSLGMEMVKNLQPTVVLIDKALGLQGVLDWLGALRMEGKITAPVVWGVSMNEAEALRMMQSGAQGVLRKTVDPETLLVCLQTVANGTSYMEQSMLQEAEKAARHSRSNLTPRELQVVELVEHGLKNKEIAGTLGIRPGTVKIHLKHIFEKTGVRGRYGLALSGLKEKGLLASSPM